MVVRRTNHVIRRLERVEERDWNLEKSPMTND